MKNTCRLFLELLPAIAILIIAATLFSMMLSSCGHNVVTHSRGIGMDISWDGSSYIPNLRLGQWDVTNAVVKENVEIETQTNTTAGASSQMASASSTNKKTTNQPSGQTQAEAKGGVVMKMKTGPQSNGYVKDILTSPNLTDQNVSIAEKIYGVKSDSSDTNKKK